LGFVQEKLERAVVLRAVGELQIQTASIEKPVQYLSGGNQQKAVLGKWLSIQSTPEQLSGPELILFDEPTRGVDVGAKSEIYNLMRRLADQGKAILMLSSELPEILGMSDRVLVMRDGRLVGELDRAEASQEKILTLAAGAAATARRGSREAGQLIIERKRSPSERFRLWLSENQGVFMVYAVLVALYLFGLVASDSFRATTNLFSILRQSVALDW
jgi:ABC-type multidrug transport system ATPase subunit